MPDSTSDKPAGPVPGALPSATPTTMPSPTPTPDAEGPGTSRSGEGRDVLDAPYVPQPAKPKPTVAPPTTAPSVPTSTGVPTGTKLARHDGDLVITQKGRTVDSVEVRGSIVVRAPDVTIKNSRVIGQKPVPTGLIGSQSTGLTVVDSEIYSEHRNPTTNGVMGSNFTLERVEIRDVVDQVHIHGSGNATVRDSWLHSNVHYKKDPNWGGKPSHDDNIQIISGSNIRIEGNRLSGSNNAAIMVTQGQSAVRNVTIRSNRVGNGGCSVNISPGSRGNINNLTIEKNGFEKNQRVSGCAIIAPSAYAPSVDRNFWVKSGEKVRMSHG